MTDPEIIAFIVKQFEGGTFTNDPLDAGGATKWGVTQRLYSAFLGRPATLDEMKALTVDRACEVMRDMFLMRTGLWQIADWRLKFVTVDAAINFGIDDAAVWLQQAAGVTADGKLGPVTWAAVTKIDPLRAAVRVLASRQQKHLDRVKKHPDQLKWLRGWIARCTTLLQHTAA
jgi:lysozyme family protein